MSGDPRRKDRNKEGGGREAAGWRRAFLRFTNVFISSLLTLMLTTGASCSCAASSSSSSSSSSNGFEPAGAALVGTVRLTTWSTVRDARGRAHVSTQVTKCRTFLDTNITNYLVIYGVMVT